MHADEFARGLARAVEVKTEIADADSRRAAVLILIDCTDADPTFVLTKRREDMRSHPGQVAFPGGRIDPGEDAVAAALREANEEVALDAATVRVIGSAELFYIPPTDFWVTPVIAVWEHPHPLEPSPDEVERILHVPLARLTDQSLQRVVALGERAQTWAWQLDDDVIWGATAVMLSTLLDVVVPNWHGGRTPTNLEEAQRLHPWQPHP